MSLVTEPMRTEIQQLCEQVFFDEPMSRHTSIRIGGPADALVYPRSVEEVTQLIALARRNHLPFFVLGAGSNLLVRDKGIRGLVISLARGFSTVRIETNDSVAGEAILYAEAGVGIPRLVDFSAESGLAGLEPLSGIPGNLGGALVMNAGTHEGDIGAVVSSVTFMEKEGRLVTWTREKIRYDYRESHFPKGVVLLSARLLLKGASPESVKEKIAKARAKRVETQPLNVPNLGSVFKNPRKGHAGRYIEESGLKDVRIGGGRISPKHANFIVNEGQASARDIVSLIGLVQDKVKEKFGVSLETEVRVVGEES